MELIVLHGPPGVGKQTIGAIVAARLGYSYLNSHRMMAEVGSVFGWGSTPFIHIRDAVVAAVQAAAATADRAGLVWTAIFEPTVELNGWNALFSAVDRALVVDLQVARNELARRLMTDARRAAGKSSTIDDIGHLLEGGTFDLPAVSAPVLVIDTTELRADEVASAIVAHLRP